MAELPPEISTALVHMDAPLSFIGEPGRLHVEILPSVSLVWAATGTPVVNFEDMMDLADGQALEIQLPHTDQDGFLDGAGNTITGWYYTVKITYEKDGQLRVFPERDFQVLVGQAEVDLALVPAGEAAMPQVAPVLTVTSIEGFTGPVSLAELQLERVDNTNDAEKPISTATQTALDLKAPKANPTFTGTVTGVTKSMVGLSAVDNTADVDKPISTAAQTALNAKLDDAQLGAASGVAPLDAGSKVPDANLPHGLDAFERTAGAGAQTDGDNIKVGNFVYAPAGVGTTYIQGGATNYENVIGGNPANVNTSTSNLTGAAALVAPNGNWSAILHGYDNVNNGWANVLTGFHCRAISGTNHGTISGGSDHKIEGVDTGYATIAGGTGSQVTANGGTVGGGYSHTVTGVQGTVAGGLSNDATGATSSVGGGQNNTASASNAAVAGGSGNTASGSGAIIAGGVNNTAAGATGTIAGGSTNSAPNQYGSVGGGLTNTASGVGATVPGGRENTALGNYSVATGRGASTTMEGQRTHASGFFAAAGDAQVSEFVARNTTTDAVAKELFLQGTGSRLTLTDDSTWFFEIHVVARRTDTDTESAAYKYTGVIDRGAGAATTAFVGTVTETVVAEDTAAWGVAVTAGTSDGTLRITATGEAAKSIRWVAYVRAVQVSG